MEAGAGDAAAGGSCGDVGLDPSEMMSDTKVVGVVDAANVEVEFCAGDDGLRVDGGIGAGVAIGDLQRIRPYR